MQVVFTRRDLHEDKIDSLRSSADKGMDQDVNQGESL